MKLLIFTSLLAFTFIFYVTNKTSLKIYFKKSLLPLFGVFVIIALIIYPKVAVSSALSGINLWFNIVFPSLFPFFVASQLLSRSGFINLFGTILEPVMRPLFNVPGCGSFALVMGIVSGYPMGAAITSDLRNQKLLSRTEAERLLTFTNNSGPLFIMGAVAVGMLKSPALGYLLYICHVSACLTVGMIFKHYKKSKNNSNFKNHGIRKQLQIELQKLRNSDINTWTLFGEAIKNSILTILNIGGFIIFFSVLINILLSSGILGWISGLIPGIIKYPGLGTKTLEGILCGLFEITTGSNLINSASASLNIKLSSISFIIGWAGLSVHTQVMSIVSTTDISVKPYITGKALQGFISAIYTFVGLTLFPRLFIADSSVFLNKSLIYTNNLGNIFKISLQNVILISLIMLVISVVYVNIVNICSKKKLL